MKYALAHFTFSGFVWYSNGHRWFLCTVKAWDYLPNYFPTNEKNQWDAFVFKVMDPVLDP